MLKRNFDDSTSPNETYCDGEPPAKQPNSNSPNVDNHTIRDISQHENSVKTVSSNGEKSAKSTSRHAHELQEKAAVEKNQFFDNVLEYFDGNQNEELGRSIKRNTGVIHSNYIILDRHGTKISKPLDAPSGVQLPQMLLNPKARVNKVGNPPDVIPITDRKFIRRLGPQVKQAHSSVAPSKSGKTFSIEGAAKEESKTPFVTVPQMKKPECCVIETLIKRFRFDHSRLRILPDEEIKIYINQGRPTPAISSLGVSQNLYDHHVWITGCPTLEKLFCWMCLLFTKRLTKSQNTVWLREGFRAMNMLGTSMTKHILSSAHKEAIEHKDQLAANGFIPKLLPDVNLNRDSSNSEPQGKVFSIGTKLQSTEMRNLVIRTCDSTPNNPVPSPPLKNPPIGSNDLNQGTANIMSTENQEVGAFQKPSPQPEVWDLTQSDVSERSSPSTVALPRPTDVFKENVAHGQYLKLMQELKMKEITVKPMKECTILQTQTPPKIPSPPAKPHTRPRIDLSTLQLKYFPNGSFTGSEMLREQIIAIGRPTPGMPGLAQDLKGVMVYFNKSYYEEFPWMCGSREMNRLYCWPCLVFNDHQHNNTWNTVGVNTLANLSSAAKIHSIDQSHLELSIRLKILEDGIKNKSAAENNPAKHNENVRQKRALLKYLIDAVCFKKKVLDNVSISHEDFNNFLMMLSTYDVKLKDMLDPKSENYIADFTPNVAANYSRETVIALAMFIKRKIAEDVKLSTYVSFILKTAKSDRVAVIVRCIKFTGEIHERFYTFIKVGFGHEETLLKKVLAEVSELKCSAKFVGISYDGGVLHPDQMESFNSKLRNKMMAAYFFHCRHDNFKGVLQQSLSYSPHCRSFLQLITEFGKFLQENPRVERSMNRLENESERMGLRSANQKTWDLESGIIGTILDHYSAIMQFLTQVVNGSLAPHSWTNYVISQCKKFSTFLELEETRMLVVLFSKVYLALHPVIEAFQGDFHAQYWKSAFGAAYSLIQDMRNNRFNEVYQGAESMVRVWMDDSSRPCGDRTKLTTMFNETLDWILGFLKYRSKYIDIWAYFDMSTKNIDGPVSKAQTNQTQFLMDLRECFPFFDSQKLGSALISIHKDANFRNKSASEITELIVKWDLKAILPELYSYFLLIQTVPFSSAHIAHPVSDRVATYVEGKTQLTSGDALLHLEKDLLASARDEENFYSEVLDMIAQLKQNPVDFD